MRNQAKTSTAAQDDILREQVRLVMRQVPTMQLAAFIVALVLAHVVRDIVPHANLVVWILLVLAIVVGRIGLYHRFRMVREGPFVGEYWKDLYLLLAFMSGVVWGLSAFILYPAGHAELVSLFVLVVASLSASTTVSHSSIKLAPAVWATPAMLLYAVRCVMEGGQFAYTLAVLIVLYLFTVLRYSLNHHASITAAIALRFENLELLEEVRKVNEILVEDIGQRKKVERALRESEARFHSIYQNSMDGILLTVPNGRFLAANPAACQILGYTEEELLNLGPAGLIDMADPELSFLFEERCLPGQSSRELTFVRKDGTRFRAELSSGRFSDEQGQVFNILLIRDITERRSAEAERLRLQRELQQAQKAESLGRMAGAVAHHFNNRLMAVMGNLELALYHLPQDVKGRANINEAMTASRRAAEISRFMLTYTGQCVGRNELLDLAGVSHDTLALVRSSLPTRVQVHTDFPTGEATVVADAAHLRQALTNLVLNACEAIGDQDGAITLAIRVVTGEEIEGLKFFPSDWKPSNLHYVCLAVSDSGCGLDPETLEQVFDPFFSTKTTGRGLGLSVLLGLVRTCDGAVNVNSEPGQGTTFRVFFPLSTQPAP